MKKHIYSFALASCILFLGSKQAKAQNLGVNATGATPDPSTILDLNTGNNFTGPNGKGLLIPNVSLVSNTDATTIASPAASLLVYNTGFGGLTPKGYWYNSGTSFAPVWLRLISGLICGAASTNFVPKFTSPTSICNSAIYDNGTTVGIGTTVLTPIMGNVLELRQDAPGSMGGSLRLTNRSLGTVGSTTGVNFGFENTGPYVTSAGIEARHDGGTSADLSFFTAWPGGNAWYARMYIQAGGNIGIGTIAPTALLSVNGTADKTGGGTWAVFSDIRLKQNIKPFSDGLDKLLQINPVTFQYNGKGGISSKETYVGVVAQEIQKVLPYTVKEVSMLMDPKVKTSAENMMEYDPNALTYILVNAVKEQQKIIENQQLAIKKLTADYDVMLKKMEDVLKNRSGK